MKKKRVDLPIGKALIPVEVEVQDEEFDTTCKHCDLKHFSCHPQYGIACTKDERADGKYVIFKMVDYNVEGEIGT